MCPKTHPHLRNCARLFLWLLPDSFSHLVEKVHQRRIKKCTINGVMLPKVLHSRRCSMLRRPARRRLRRPGRRRLRGPARRRRAESCELMSRAGRCRGRLEGKPDERSTRSNGGFRWSIFRQIPLNLGCQTGHLAGESTAKVSQTTPIPNVGCQTGHFRCGFARIVSQTTPITNVGCQTGHFRCGFARKVSQTAPITNLGCQTGHFRCGFAREASQTAPIASVGCKRDLRRPVFPSDSITGARRRGRRRTPPRVD